MIIRSKLYFLLKVYDWPSVTTRGNMESGKTVKAVISVQTLNPKLCLSPSRVPVSENWKRISLNQFRLVLEFFLRSGSPGNDVKEEKVFFFPVVFAKEEREKNKWENTES